MEPNTSTIKIQHGVVPPNASNGRKSIYPFADMEVDDHFTVEAQGSEILSVQRKIVSAAYGFNQRTGNKWRFTTKVDRERNTVTMWRVA